MPSPTLHDVHANDAAMTQISIGYSNAEYFASLVSPIVPVLKKSDFYYIFPKQTWQRKRVAERAPGAIAERSDYELTTGSYKCVTYATSKAVPDEVRANADAPLRPDVEAAEFVTDGLLLGLELRVAAITTGGSGLWAYSTTPTTAWSDATSDPFGDIDGAVNGVVGSIGRRPNTAIMSWNVWRYLRQHPDFLDRIKYTRPGGRLETTDLTSWFDIQNIYVGATLYDPAEVGQTASPSYVWGDQFWCGFVAPAPSLRTPSALYTFEWMGRSVTRYREDQRHQDVFEATHSTDEVISASDAGAVLYNCV